MAIGARSNLYAGFVRWLDKHWLTILEIIVCIILLAIGVTVGVYIMIARLAGFIGSGGNPF